MKKSGLAYLISGLKADNFYLLLSGMITGFCVIQLIISTILLLCGLSLMSFILPVSLVLTIALMYIAVKKYSTNPMPAFIMTLLVFTLLCIIFMFIAGMFFDATWDGQEYHQTATIKLKEGWNPIYTAQPTTLSSDTRVQMWVNHYPKASWILAANLYMFTGNIEYSKMYNLLFIAVSFLLALAVLTRFKRIKRTDTIVIALLIACNPVSIYQALSFYIDGMLSSIILSLFLLAALIFLENDNKPAIAVSCMLIIIALNIKYTALIYTFIVIAGIGAGLYLKNKKVKQALIIPGVLLIAFFTGIVFFGSTSYMRNMVVKGHPLYPLMGAGKYDLMGQQYPTNFKPMKTGQRFYHSLFSESANYYINQSFYQSFLKAPFTMKLRELKAFDYGDVRISGFGPLFSGIILLSLTLMLTRIIFLCIQRRFKQLLLFILPLLWIALAVLINPECWWARLVPHLWTFPIAVIILSLITGNDKEDNTGTIAKTSAGITGALRFITLLLLIANISMIGGSYFYFQYRVSEDMKRHLTHFQTSGEEVQVAANLFETASYSRLQDYGIPYKKVNQVTMQDCRYFISPFLAFRAVSYGIPLTK